MPDTPIPAPWLSEVFLRRLVRGYRGNILRGLQAPCTQAGPSPRGSRGSRSPQMLLWGVGQAGGGGATRAGTMRELVGFAASLSIAFPQLLSTCWSQQGCSETGLSCIPCPCPVPAAGTGSREPSWQGGATCTQEHGGVAQKDGGGHILVALGGDGGWRAHDPVADLCSPGPLPSMPLSSAAWRLS